MTAVRAFVSGGSNLDTKANLLRAAREVQVGQARLHARLQCRALRGLGLHHTHTAAPTRQHDGHVGPHGAPAHHHDMHIAWADGKNRFKSFCT